MYLKKTKNAKTGRIYLSIAKKYRHPGGTPRDEQIMKIGYLDELEKRYADPIAHFGLVARKMTEEEKKNKKVTLTLDTNE